jgi:DNA polymerase I-like protein with 3'-5' exonuclease and polymerase domains
MRRTDKGLPAGQGWYAGPTGRRWVFHEHDHPFKDGTSFSPTQLKNYPVQGFATGDIVPLVLGKLFRVLKNSEYAQQALLINTVHDSIILDVKKEVLDEVCKLVKDVMESAPAYLDEVFGIKFDLPLPVGISYGPTWGEQKEWSV